MSGLEGGVVKTASIGGMASCTYPTMKKNAGVVEHYNEFRKETNSEKKRIEEKNELRNTATNLGRERMRDLIPYEKKIR